MDFLLPALAVALVIGLIAWLLRRGGPDDPDDMLRFGGGGGRGRR